MKTRLILLAVAATLALSSCSAPASPPVETPTPTPTEMTTADAGTFYLATVCPANAAQVAYNDAATAYDAAEVKDFAPLPAAAATARDAARTAAERLDDDTVIWPEKLVDDIEVIRDSYFGSVSAFGQQADATTIEQFIAVSWPSTDEASAASQRLRSRLELPADTNEGCAEYLG